MVYFTFRSFVLNYNFDFIFAIANLLAQNIYVIFIILVAKIIKLSWDYSELIKKGNF